MTRHEHGPAPDATHVSLTSLLVRHDQRLFELLRREGTGLLRYESLSDLAQGVKLHALEVQRHFQYRSDREFVGWLKRVARQHIADRNEYWTARKRDAGKLIRITTSDLRDGERSRRGVHPAASWLSASSFAERKEQLAIAARAASILLPRDQEIVRFLVLDLDIGQMAERLGISYDAAERARLRTLERFRKACRLLAQAPTGGSSPS